MESSVRRNFKMSITQVSIFNDTFIYLLSTKCYTYDKKRVQEHSFGFCGVFYLMGG